MLNKVLSSEIIMYQNNQYNYKIQQQVFINIIFTSKGTS